VYGSTRLRIFSSDGTFVSSSTRRRGWLIWRCTSGNTHLSPAQRGAGRPSLLDAGATRLPSPATPCTRWSRPEWWTASSARFPCPPPLLRSCRCRAWSSSSSSEQVAQPTQDGVDACGHLRHAFEEVFLGIPIDQQRLAPPCPLRTPMLARFPSPVHPDWFPSRGGGSPGVETWFVVHRERVLVSGAKVRP
jgi:hypothetical protein